MKQSRGSITVCKLVAFGFLTMLLFNFGCSKKGPEQKELSIGCITPLTGAGASFGRQTKEGIDLAVEEINARGGISGKKIVVHYEDDEKTPSVATAAIHKLINSEKVPLVIGGFTSTVTLALAPIAEKNKVVLISASSTADDIKDAGDYIFRIVPTNSAQGKSMAEFAMEKLGAKNAGVLFMNDDYGITLKDGVIARFTAMGGKVEIVEAYSSGDKDFRSQLSKIRKAEVDVVFFPGLYEESGLILRQARELGIVLSFIGGDGAVDPKLIEVAKEAADNSYYANLSIGYGIADNEIKRFVNSFRTTYGKKPSAYNAYAYDVVYVVAEAIEQGGLSAEGIKGALYALKGFKGVTGETVFDSYGEVDKSFGIYTVKNGEFVPVLQ